MVKGLDIFRAHFAGHADQFVLIAVSPTALRHSVMRYRAGIRPAEQLASDVLRDAQRRL
jgi:hypothetical protein